jgi:hypothetical protein
MLKARADETDQPGGRPAGVLGAASAEAQAEAGQAPDAAAPRRPAGAEAPEVIVERGGSLNTLRSYRNAVPQRRAAWAPRRRAVESRDVGGQPQESDSSRVARRTQRRTTLLCGHLAPVARRIVAGQLRLAQRSQLTAKSLKLAPFVDVTATRNATSCVWH